jgi:hypothetical protein
MCRACSIIVTLLAIGTLGLAQQTSSDDAQTIRLLSEQVKELQGRVRALENGQTGAQHENASAAATVPPSEEDRPAALGIDRLHNLRGIEWRGFGEVNYKLLDQRKPELGNHGFVPGSAGNVYTGDFDLLLTSRINDKAGVLSEIVFGEGDAQSYGVDIERFLFKYDFDDRLRMSFGRYHTAIGYYNTAFHSGKWLQTTADRPLIMEFAAHGGLLPTQAIGVSVTGLIPSGKLGLNYLAEYGSSDTIRPEISGSGVMEDENNGNSINLGLFARPDAVRGLQVGTSFYHDRISYFEISPSARAGQTIVNGHVVYARYGVEFLNEVFLIRHALEQSNVVLNMPAFYTQFSKQLGRFRPFFRYQYLNANPRSMFEEVRLRHGPSFGARYDVNDNVAFKMQLDHTIRSGQPDLNGLQTQVAFTF